MTSIFASEALTPDGWRRDCRIVIEDGRIASIEADQVRRPDDDRHAILLPAMPTLHSHAFQRAMAGLAERRGPGDDSFWTWRETMYRFALSLTPDDVEAIAMQLYMEMLEAGFARVGEFHYLHHDRDGGLYTDIAEMAVRIAGAAAETGIGLTLLPVFYAQGGFGGAAPHDGQRRFLSTRDSYARLMEGCGRALASLPGSRLGIAPHSLRAVSEADLAHLLAAHPSGPVHIHVAEQVAEVEACLAYSGQRPVEFLMDRVAVDRRWCLIHATHMTEAETAALAVSGAVAGLCPITEANLGDGIFNSVSYFNQHGAFGIGSDSNILISLSEELRTLEYAQRLNHRIRTALAPKGGSNGRALYDAALIGGSRALGDENGGIRVGAEADLVSLDPDHPALIGRSGDALLDGFLFAASNGIVDSVWARGVKCVAKGRHHHRDRIEARFRAVMTALLVRD